MKKKLIYTKSKKIVAIALASFFIGTIMWAILYSFLPVPYTPFIFARSFQTGSFKIQKKWVPLIKVSDNLLLALISAEDQLFLEHIGFDVNAIEKAVIANQKNKQKLRGGSTISQQTAKNAFLFPNRSWVRKGLEVYFTTMIELLWSKKRIMEVYVNIIEFGPGIYGAEAASKHFFNKRSKDLNRYEAALLAAVVPSPLKYRVDRPSAYVRKRQIWILQQMSMLRPEPNVDKLLENAGP
jgi:monofunctional biosynthetic peptidoglycan transglycosylase